MCARRCISRRNAKLLLESETVISQKTDVFVDESTLSDDEFLIFQALQQQSSLKVQDIAILNKKNIFQSFKTDR
jgi:primosomal protein N' (replication factor Y)